MYRRFREMNIDHGAVGLVQQQENYRYFCTPKDAEIIGWAGVDGIHYCTVPEFGEMIFAVSPMNVGDYVHPIAANFRDLLRLLLCCGDMAALEQCYAWDEEQFKAFAIDCPITVQQQAVLDALRAEFGLKPMEDPFGYVKALQRDFDLSAIAYTEDYYDPDMNPAAPLPKEWKVTYDGGFWSGIGSAGQETPVGKHFRWGEENWYIPAVYNCTEGLVVDFCMEAESDAILAYINKWDLYNELRNHYTRQQQAQMEQEHPLRVDFQSEAGINGKLVHSTHGYGLTWLPEACVPPQYRSERDAEAVLEHYGLDKTRAWSIRRCAYPWPTARKPKLRSLELKLIRDSEQIMGISFPSSQPGEQIRFLHPVTGEAHCLTVQSCEETQLDEKIQLDPYMEYPRHYTLMCYTVTPPVSGLAVQDAAEGDSPRPRRAELGQLSSDEAAALALIGGADGPAASSVGVIGGSDGPTALILGHSTPKKSAACSALRFAPAETVRWQLRFSVKRMEDLSVKIL